MTEFQRQREHNADQTIIVTQPSSDTNSIGLVGFILALIALFTGWIPLVGWVMWFLGLVFSFAGVFKVPRGFAIAGLVISLLGIILLLMFIVVFGTAIFFST